ncbi:RagB/SusD family nutrient uptake outer membrane protein [Flavihumibacter profundi]|jgi:starch-binding outer membrane protein, SusD/RagB family|uniref:RagB/SusD family nutrient uptake outer membrane protein n=1 Tax=Flavihumibacter profundi TaxID=2716883 RepID=UPI001CC6AEC2|nr:RagB/SusD family nutrient uptake outer membrane protein [Flavihumibacter profundi]MBZ5855521.1 RagB/SusD family nutrient uptake outer membrane protein [Flavihumibacter profundi]
MKYKIFIATSIALSALFGTGCTKVLDKAPLDSYTDQSVWSDLTLTEAFADNIYNLLPTSTYDWGNSINRSYILSCASDEGFNKFDYAGVRSVITKGILSPDNAGDFDIWAKNYYHIQNANLLLSKIDGVPGDESTRNRIKGEVTFLRAYAYYQLVSDYGGVPLVKTPFDLNSDFTVPRSSYEECVKFIVDELDLAAQLLPASNNSSNIGKVTSALAMAIKSRVLLYAASAQWNPTNDRAKWEAASAAAKAVIDLGQFALYTGNYADIFTTFNEELIGVKLSGKQYNWNAFDGVEMMSYPSGFHGWAAFAPTQNLVDAFGMADGKSIADAGSGYNPQKPYTNRDPRFYADIVYDGRPLGNPAYVDYRVSSTNPTGTQAEFYEGGLDSPQGLDTWNNSETRYTFRKYMDTTYDFNATTQTNKFWILSRLGEIYLNYAEAEFHLGREDNARKYLDLIRQRAGIANPLTESGAALEKRIQNEREVELCFEGHRYYDVRRWKIAEATQNVDIGQVIINRAADGTKTYTYQTLEQRIFQPANYLLPIPKTEINRTSLQQNPGYN